MKMRYNGNSPVRLTWADGHQVVAVGAEIEVADDQVPQYTALGFALVVDAPARKRPAPEETHADEPGS